MKNKKHSPLGTSWTEHEKELKERGILTDEIIAESDLAYAIICELIEARKEDHLSQRGLERLSGVRYPIIARIETGKVSPRLSTILRILAPLGKTLAVVPIGSAHKKIR